MRQCQIQADRIRSVERPSVLPDHADSNTGFQQCIHIGIMLLAPLLAVEVQHVRSFWFGKLHALEMLENVVVRIIRIRFQHFAQFIHPLISLRPVSADQRMNREYVRRIVVGKGRSLLHTVAQHAVVDDVVGAHKACEVKGLGRCIKRDGTLACIFGNGLRRDMFEARQCQIRPDLIGDDNTVVGLVNFHRFFNLLALPDTARRVVRRTENGEMNVVFF